MNDYELEEYLEWYKKHKKLPRYILFGVVMLFLFSVVIGILGLIFGTPGAPTLLINSILAIIIWFFINYKITMSYYDEYKERE